MKSISNLFILVGFIFLSVALSAQTAPPTGPAAVKAIKAYSEHKLDDLAAVLPDLIKAHPNHPYTIFFKAYIADNKDNNVSEALKGYSEVIKIAPDIMEAYFFRARIFNEKGMYEKAIEDMSNAIKYDDSKASNLYTMRGEIYSSAGKNTEAYNDFKQAIVFSPALATNYRGLMNTGLKANRIDDAAATIRKAIEGTESKNASVWEVWGDMNLRTKQFAVADKAYDISFTLIGAKPTADSYNSAAIAALNTNNFSKAKRLAEEAVQEDPKGYLYYCTRSEISVQDKTWEEVYTWAQKALQVNEKSARANKLMAIGVKRTNRGEALSKEYDFKSKKYEAEGDQ